MIARVPVVQRLSALRAAIVMLALGACAGQDEVVQRGLLCYECATETQQLVNLGDAAVGRLRVALREGPSSTARSNYKAQSVEELRMARRAQPVSGAPVPLSDSAVFVDGALQNLVASYQKRAAWALRVIGTPTARVALHQAHVDSAQLGWRADVRSLVQRLDSDTPVTSVTVTSPVDTLPLLGSATLAARVNGAGQVPQGVTWQTSDSARAPITAGGVVTRLVSGGGPVLLKACSTANTAVCGAVAMRIP